jgi:uncharacterized protein
MEDDRPGFDLAVLDRYLASDAAPDGCLGLSELDGFLTGIVVGPEPVPTRDWLPVVWGGAEPDFPSDAVERTVLGTVMGRYHAIGGGFNVDPAVFEPIFRTTPGGTPIITDWAVGFLAAVALRRRAWEPLFSHRRASLLLMPLLILGDDAEFRRQRPVAATEKLFYASKPGVILTCALGINDFWFDWRGRRGPAPRRRGRPRR